MAPFRECYGRLNELRSLASPVNILAVTATATKETKNAIVDILRMKDPFEISESPEKPNVTYVVETIPKEASLQQCFSWLVDEVKVKGVDSERTIIYCQTINQCGRIHSTLKAMIGDSFFIGTIGDRRNVGLEMLHSCSPSANKEAVLRSFNDPNGTIRVLVATIAFGMGVDCKGVHRTIHFGPSKNLESFVQETGRAGRDGKQSTSYLLYNGLLLAHVEKDIKEYINNHECRRKTLLKQFTNTRNTTPVVPHLCCDNCALRCKCASQQCKKPGVIAKPSIKPNSKEREVTKSQKDELWKKLTLYHKSLVMMFMGEHAHGEIKSFTNLHLLVGFSDLQIRQVIEKCTKLFNIDDICDHVEIWHLEHAYKIHSILSQVFGDLSMDEVQDYWFNDESEIEDEIENALGEWNPLIEDDDFLDLILENLSMSLLSLDRESNTSLGGDVPNAVLEVLENFSFKET